MKVDNRIVQFVLRSLAVLLLSLNASAQADYHVGHTIELNTIGLGDADHAVIAVNSFGDVIIVNHTQVGQDAKATELNTLVTLGNTMAFGYKLFNTRRVGDPTLNIFGVGNCKGVSAFPVRHALLNLCRLDRVLTLSARYTHTNIARSS